MGGWAEVVIGKAEVSKGADAGRSCDQPRCACGWWCRAVLPRHGNLVLGDVVRVNDTGERVVSSEAVRCAVMGVITDEPGLLLGGVARTGDVVAVTGVVQCKVEADNTPVEATFSSRAVRLATPVWSIRLRQAPSVRRCPAAEGRVSSLFCSVAANGGVRCRGRSAQGSVPRGRPACSCCTGIPATMPIGGESEPRVPGLGSVLGGDVLASKDIVLTYNVSQGVQSLTSR